MAIGDPNQLPMGMAGPLNLTPQPSYTPPPVPFGYGQMQGMPALSRNPNYGVPSGIGSLLGGQNPMMAPQAGALLSPQAPVSTNALAGTNPFTGGGFQTFTAGDVTQAASDYRTNQAELLRQAEAQAAAQQQAAEAAAKAEADRIAAEQAAAAEAARIAQEQEAARIAAEQAAAAAEAKKIAQEQAAAEAQAQTDTEATATQQTAQQTAAEQAAADVAARIASGEVVMPTKEEIMGSVRPSVGMGGDKGGPGGVLPAGGVVMNPIEPPMTGGFVDDIRPQVPGEDFIPFVPPPETGIGSLIGVGRPDTAGRGTIPPPPPPVVRPPMPSEADMIAAQGNIPTSGFFGDIVSQRGEQGMAPASGSVAGLANATFGNTGKGGLASVIGGMFGAPSSIPRGDLQEPTVIPEIDLDAIRRRVAVIQPEPDVALPTPIKGRKSITQAIPTRTKEIPAISTAAVTPPKPNTQQVETKPKTRKKQQPKKKRKGGRRGARGRG
tara:strand:- start:2534 stop:4015 length:1482 start_codon:yes stop_codon:yes gene_type:complete